MRKFKFNILDAFIVLFVLCIAFAIVVKFTGSENVLVGGDKYTSVEYVLKVESMRDFTADAIKENVDIYIDEPRMHVGKIDSKKIEPAMANQVLADGTTKRVQVEERFDVYITVKAEGIQKVDGFYVNGNQCLNVGSENTFRIGNVVVYGKIYEIKD